MKNMKMKMKMSKEELDFFKHFHGVEHIDAVEDRFKVSKQWADKLFGSDDK